MTKMGRLFTHSNREVFILRFWLGGMDGQEMNGSIQHVDSQATYPLDMPEILLGLFLEQMGLVDTCAGESRLK